MLYQPNQEVEVQYTIGIQRLFYVIWFVIDEQLTPDWPDQWKQ